MIFPVGYLRTSVTINLYHITSQKIKGSNYIITVFCNAALFCNCAQWNKKETYPIMFVGVFLA
jgi:hypothetical protein